MNTIPARLEALESAAAESAGCRDCAHVRVLVYTDSEPVPPERCEKCGREFLRVHVVYVKQPCPAEAADGAFS